MKEGIKIYIAGKVTGENRLDVLYKFSKAEQLIKSYGFVAVNPIRVVNNWDCPWEEAMKLCINALLECDAVYPLPCAARSRGAMLELQIARSFDKEIINPTIIQSKNNNDMTLAEIIYKKMLQNNKQPIIELYEIEQLIVEARQNTEAATGRIVTGVSSYYELLFNTVLISALEYGEAKWNEAANATRDSIVGESPMPPKFIA
jgi:hypothetical protein